MKSAIPTFSDIWETLVPIQKKSTPKNGMDFLK